MEEWRDIPNLEGMYKVSNTGKVMNIQLNKLVKSFHNKKGYLHLMLTTPLGRKHFSVHRLVALAFIPNVNNYPEVNHLNMIRDDNRVENLEWCTHTYNMFYGDAQTKRRHHKKNKAILMCSLHTDDVIKTFISINDAARQVGLLPSTISRACSGYFKQAGGYRWRYYND